MILSLLLLVACTDDEDTDPADDSGSTTPTDDSGDTSGPTDKQGTTGYDGEATVTAEAYDGTEEWWFKGEDGADLCRMRSRLVSTAVRADCESCEWAFDLVRSEAELVTEGDPGCAELAGTTPEALDGLTASYGYDDDYFGHGKVLMVEIDGAWQGTSFATWDTGTGAFLYAREDGTFLY